VTYEPGELKVVTYKNGKEWATANMRTAGVPSTLLMTPDRPRISADGHDLFFVTVRITDQDGLTVPRANDRIRFTLDGPGSRLETNVIAMRTLRRDGRVTS